MYSHMEDRKHADLHVITHIRRLHQQRRPDGEEYHANPHLVSNTTHHAGSAHVNPPLKTTESL